MSQIVVLGLRLEPVGFILSVTLHFSLEEWPTSLLASLKGTYFHHLPGLLGTTGLGLDQLECYVGKMC